VSLNYTLRNPKFFLQPPASRDTRHHQALGIRVLSNNVTNGGTYDAKTGEACQEYVYDVVKAYIGTTLKR
jgi:hypothetical protein